VEMGYEILPGHRRRGYASEAGRVSDQPVRTPSCPRQTLLQPGTLGRSLLRSTVSPARPWMLGPATPPVDLVAISALWHAP
jgi:hypothetical protein